MKLLPCCRCAIAPLLLFIMIPSDAGADLTIKMKSDATPTTTKLTATMLRQEVGSGQVLIFRADKQLLWMIEPAKKSYSEITRSDLDAMSAQMADAKAQMEEAMKGVPPEQRAMMEKMMKDKMPGAAAGGKEPERTVQPTEEKKTINGFPCTKYIVKGGKGSSEVWAADIGAIEIRPDDLAVLAKFGEFMSALAPSPGLRDLAKDYKNPKPNEVPGLPVLTIVKDPAGKETHRYELVGIDKGTLGAAEFDLPSGLKKEASPMQAPAGKKR